jgi:hypothetical protein
LYNWVSGVLAMVWVADAECLNLMHVRFCFTKHDGWWSCRNCCSSVSPQVSSGSHGGNMAWFRSVLTDVRLIGYLTGCVMCVL